MRHACVIYLPVFYFLIRNLTVNSCTGQSVSYLHDITSSIIRKVCCSQILYDSNCIFDKIYEPIKKKKYQSVILDYIYKIKDQQLHLFNYTNRAEHVKNKHTITYILNQTYQNRYTNLANKPTN